MAFNNFVLEAVENHIQVDVIYTNFAKAFDRVDQLRPYTNLGLANHFCCGSNPI